MHRAREFKIGTSAGEIKKTNFNQLFMVESLNGPREAIMHIDTTIVVRPKKDPTEQKRVKIHRTVLYLYVSKYDGTKFD